jgi:hypothetical protein
MTTITDEYMQQMMTKTRAYCFVLLKPGPKADQADGLLSIVCPVTAETGVAGLGIFNASVEETKKIMDDDPGVQAGVFVYEVHPCRSFPGDSLPA